MADWTPTQRLDYAPGIEDLGGFAEKYQAVVEEQIFELLNQLRRGGVASGLDATDAVAYEMRVNTADNGLYFRNGNNKEWILVGYIEPLLGLKATDIGAIINGGGINKITCGTEDNLPTTGNKTNDFYFAYDTSRLFRFTGSAWKTFLSLRFEDMLNYEKYCISRKELTEKGEKGKIPVLDSITGKGNFDITGSAERIWDKLIEIQDLHNGDTLIYNAEKDRFVNLAGSIDELVANWDFTETAISAAVKHIEETLDLNARVESVVEGLKPSIVEAATSVAVNTVNEALGLEDIDLDKRIDDIVDAIDFEQYVKDAVQEIIDSTTPTKKDSIIYVGEDQPTDAQVWIKTPAGTTPATPTTDLNMKDLVVSDTEPTTTVSVWINTGASYANA